MKKIVQNLLLPFSKMFGATVAARRTFYENDVLTTHDLNVPTISVGNLTVGGTGKTPLVRFVAEVLAAQGLRVCILTRGYKRQNPSKRVLVSDGKQILSDAANAGDEPFELANKLLGIAAVIADKNRFAAGVWARRNLNATAFVLDDGFQHWQLKRDLDIVCVDATNPFGNCKLLPAGILRESLPSLKRADLIAITRADLLPQSKVEILKLEIAKHNPKSPILLAQNRIINLVELNRFHAKTSNSNGDQSKIQNLKSKICVAFCGLGNPANFYESLRLADFKICATLDFADHYLYAQTDVEKIEGAARNSNAEMLLTTAKDAVKLQSLHFNLPCFVVEIAVVFDDDKPLRQLIAAL